jgi:hypothetical protein
MHTIFARLLAGQMPALRGVRRLGVLALLASVCLAPASAWGQLYGRPVAQPYFDFPTWARFSDCRPGPLPWGYDVFPEYGPLDCGPCEMPPTVACPGDWVAHRPSDWYATAEFAPLTIDHHDSFVVARTGPDGPIALRTDDLRPEFDAGGKFTIGRRIFDCYRLEGTYLGNYDWQDALVVTSPDADLSTFLSGFADPPIAGLDNAASVSLAFESSLQSGEINLRYWADMPPGPFDVSYLVGARYIRISEQYNFVADVPVPDTVNDALVNTENEMIGLQLGIQFSCLKSARFWCEMDLKGGMYNNRINLTTSFIETVPGDAVETGAAITRDRTAWVGDLALSANWQMTPNWTFRLGYQALFVNGVALGNDNLVGNADLFGLNEARLDDSGELVYHGPTIGLTWMR